jgi:type I restriction enzyme S subunit
VPFDEFWIDYTDSKRKLQQKLYAKKGPLAVIDQGADLIGGYTDDLSKQSLAPLPVVVFGDHTRIVKYFEKPFVQGADGVRVLCATPPVNPRFAYYALKCLRLPDKGYSRHFKFLKATSFPVAPLAEQRRIVAKVENLAMKSARARGQLDHVLRLIEKYKQAVLAAELGAKSGKDVVPFGDIVSLLNGDRGKDYPSDSEQLSEGYCLFLGTKNVRQGYFDFDEVSFISKEKHLALRGGTMKRGDIVVTIRGTLGNCAVYDEDVPFDVVRINSAMMIIRSRVPADPHFLMWTIRSPTFLGWVTSNSRGSAQAHLRGQDIEKALVYFPAVEKQRAIVQRINAAFAWIDRLAVEANSAHRLVDQLDYAVLAKAFQGKLVPQDANDERVSLLMDRLRHTPKSRASARRGAKGL